MTKKGVAPALAFLLVAGLSTTAMSAPTASPKTDSLAKKQAPAPKPDSLAKKQAPAPKADSLVQKQSAAQAPDTATRLHFGHLSISTVPAGAEVSLDSVQKGQSPLTLDSLVPGTHVLIVKAAGYFGKKVSVDVPADSAVSLKVTLVLPARLVVVSQPSGAAAFLDNKELGVTPCDNPRIKPGDHTLKIEKAGFAPLEKRMALTEGKTDTASATLQPLAAAGTVQKAAPAAKKKGFDRIAAIIAVGAFVVFGVAILAVEMNEAAH
ncbi:MAG TPA: PEGA domain-containing protein [Chitinivibrionales bacterium]|jgi:hypothetical protein|nr:PEGA domain-containing protein [Chitinivibrionales bacterium]